MSVYYFITSKLNGNVMTVDGANTAPRTAIVSAPINTQNPDSQLWEQIPTGPVGPDGGQGQYYLRSKLNGFVLDITGSNTAPRTPLINFPTNSPASNNQIWQFIESTSVEGAFYITSNLNNFVADIYGSNTATGTPIISFPQNVPTSNNQLWTFVPVPDPGHKKKALPPNKKSGG